MTPIEIMALIVVVITAIKIVMVLINPKFLMIGARVDFGSPILTTIVSLVLMVIALKYLLVEMTIVQVFAAMLFFCPLILMGFTPYSKDILQLASKVFEDKDILKKVWLAIIIWAILIVWVLYTLFI